MSVAWRVAAGIPAVVFISLGVAWLLVPGFASAQLRMPLLEGDGLSTQIGDLAAFFLTMGGSIAIGLVTHRAVWLYPAIMLLFLAATGRLIAWLAHGAGLALDMIVVELVVGSLLVVVARKIGVAEG